LWWLSFSVDPRMLPSGINFILDLSIPRADLQSILQVLNDHYYCGIRPPVILTVMPLHESETAAELAVIQTFLKRLEARLTSSSFWHVHAAKACLLFKIAALGAVYYLF
jgi:hypothetical protein